MIDKCRSITTQGCLGTKLNFFFFFDDSGEGTSNISCTAATSSNSSQLPLDCRSCEMSLDHLLSSHASTVIEEYHDIWISVEKDQVWQRAIQPTLRSGQLAVEYVGQTGVDAGAIRGDFLVTDLDRKLFEGNPYRWLPLKDREMEGMFEIAGMMQAHSVLQGGPNLNPAVYAEPLQVEDMPVQVTLFKRY